MRATSLLLFLIISLLSSSTTLAQTCGHCHNRPSVATFDFDIQVAPPNSADTTANLWPEWKALFMLSSVVSTKLFNANKACIKFTQPPSFDSGDTTLLSVGGETFTNLPTNPN